MSTIPLDAVTWLTTETTPAKREAFDLKYGAGASAQVFDEINNPAPEPEVEPRSWQDTAWAITKDISEGVIEAPVTVASGLYEGTIAQPASFLSSLVGDVLVYNPENGEWFDYISPEEFKERDRRGENHLTDLNPLVGVGEDTYTGKFINDASQFVGAFVGLGKVFKSGQAVLGSSKAATAATVGSQTAAATFLAYGGNEGRITDMLLDMGVPDEMLPDFLETDPDDSEAMGRLKNVVEEGPLGALGVFAVKAFRAIKRGDQQALEAVITEADEARAAMSDEINNRIEIDQQNAAAQHIEAETSPETPVNGDLSVTEQPSIYPEKVDGFGMSHTHHKRLERLAVKLTANPDGDIKGDMGWRSHDLIDSPAAVEAEIAATSRVLAKQFNEVKGNPQTEQLWAMQAGKKAKALAKLTGVDDQKIIETVSSFDNPRSMAAELMARENYALSLAENITEIARAIRSHKDTGDITGIHALGYKNHQEATLAILQRRELAANVVAAAQGARSNIARAMRAMQVVRKGDENLLRMISKNQGMERTADEIIAAALDGPTKKKDGLLKNVANSSGKLGDAINFYRINALLSGPGTQEVNLISNALNSFAIPLQQAVGSAVSLNPTQFLHATRTLRGLVGGMRESFVTALKAGYNDEAILDPFNGKMDVQDGTAPGGNIASKVVALPSRFLMSVDEFFKQAQYRGRVFADAAAEADVLGKSGQERTDYVSSYISKSFDEFGSATRADALIQAQRSTFTENLDDGLSRSLQDLAIKHGAVRFIIPFVRTPLNVLSQGFQHIPVMGAISGRLRRDIAAGGHHRAQAIGKQVIGSALAGTALVLAAQGRITGSGPKDPRVRAQWLRTNKPYSFVTQNPDGSISFTPYQRYEPFSYPLALAADLVEVLEYADRTSRVEAEEMAAAVISVFAENTINKTFTQGLADAFELMVDPESNMQNWLEKQAGSFVPNAIPQIVDAKERVEIRSIMDMMLSRIGMDGSLDRRRNALGEVDVNHGSKTDPLGIFAKDVRERDIVLEELTRLSEAHQSGFGTPPSRMGNIDLRDEPYSDDQSMYDRWMEIQSTIKIGGMTLRERLEKTILSRSYQRLSDGNRDFTGENEKLLKKIILKYRQEAEARLVKENRRFKDLHINYLRQRRDIKRRSSRGALIEDIMNGPRS